MHIAVVCLIAVYKTYTIKIFYDGDCPFCVREIDFLRSQDRGGVLQFENIAGPNFTPERYGMTAEQALARIHGQLSDGRVISGPEVFRVAYGALGWRIPVALSRLPGIAQTLELLYLLFAKNRIRLGRIFGRKVICESDRCQK